MSISRSRVASSQTNSNPVSVSLRSRVILSPVRQQVVNAPYPQDRVRQSLLLADDAARRFEPGIAAYRTSLGADASVAAVWSYAFVGALHTVTLWWLRDPARDIDAVAEQLTELLWSGMEIRSTRTKR
jgi:hypothetical protein